MAEGTLVKWNKKQGDKVKAGDEIADIETDKATMPFEAAESGVLAVTAVAEGEKVAVGTIIGVIAEAGEDPTELRSRYEKKGGSAAKVAQSGPSKQATAKPNQPDPSSEGSAALSDKPKSAGKADSQEQPGPKSAAKGADLVKPAKTRYDYDLIVIGGGPAGYAAAIRAGQLKKRVLCVEKENLGGTCLNWGCIPTKALLEDGAFVRKLRTEATDRGVTIKEMKVDFAKIIARSRGIAEKLSKGIGFLFSKHQVRRDTGTGQLLKPHLVRITTEQGTREASADHVILATGAKPTELPFAKFDGRQIITSREAMNLPTQPRRMAIIGAGAIGCEFADFYNAIGTEVTLIEMLPHLLPNEDEDVSILIERSFAKRGINVCIGTKTEKIEKSQQGVKLTLSGKTDKTIEADVVLVAVGVTGNTQGVADPNSGLAIERGRIKVDPQYKTNLENVWAVGDCVSIHFPEQEAMAGYRHPDLAHVAHHEAMNVVEHLFAGGDHRIDYRFIPGCTYTHPQVASMGMNEKTLREQKRNIRIGKFPFGASGRALAAGATEGFVKLLFDAEYGELLGVHMVGENVTELLAELVLARKLEATEAEIIEAMHPHPTMSEAIMEAAGVADGRAIHI